MAAQAKVISMRNLNLKISPEFSRLVLSICFLMNLRFLLRWEIIWIQSDICIKKWIYLERNTFHRLWAISEGKRALKGVILNISLHLQTNVLLLLFPITVNDYLSTC